MAESGNKLTAAVEEYLAAPAPHWGGGISIGELT